MVMGELIKLQSPGYSVHSTVVLCELYSHRNTLYTIQSLHYYVQYTVTAQCTVIIFALLYKQLQYIRVHCPVL